jgi:hypothetical protein
MIALEGMKRVDVERMNVPPLEEWNWIPQVSDLELLRQKVEAMDSTATNLTSRNTFQSQLDHGETY